MKSAFPDGRIPAIRNRDGQITENPTAEPNLIVCVCVFREEVLIRRLLLVGARKELSARIEECGQILG